MVLSRIWSAFIIIAIAIASIKYISTSHYKTIFNDMVVGKGGDTVKVASQNINMLSPIIRDSLMKKNDFHLVRHTPCHSAGNLNFIIHCDTKITVK